MKKIIICIICFVLIQSFMMEGKVVKAETNSVIKSSIFEKEEVDSKRAWKVKFNQSLSSDTLKDNPILVVNSKNEKVNCTYTLIDDNKSVLIDPPSEGYTGGESYSIQIGKGTKSAKGKLLSKDIIKQFTIKVDPNVVPKSSIYGKIIVLDAGHGGYDPGAVGNGVYEKNLNINLVTKIKKVLEEKGAAVKLTREPSRDIYVSLQDRAKFANSIGADFFISIHHDSNKNGAVSGVSTHYSSYRPGIETEGAYVNYNGKNYKYVSEVTNGNITNLKFSNGNSTSSININDCTAFDPTPCEAAKESGELANNILNSLCSLGLKNLGAKDHNLYVTRWTKIPSVLIEAGFISNLSELNKINNDAECEVIAKTIVCSIEKYYNDIQIK